MNSENPIFENHQELSSVISELTLQKSKLVLENELLVSSLIDGELSVSESFKNDKSYEANKQVRDGKINQ